MIDNMSARMDEMNWIRCRKCGHKLMRILNNPSAPQEAVFEMKCHSCKTINLWKGLIIDKK